MYGPYKNVEIIIRYGIWLQLWGSFGPQGRCLVARRRKERVALEEPRSGKAPAQGSCDIQVTIYVIVDLDVTYCMTLYYIVLY